MEDTSEQPFLVIVKEETLTAPDGSSGQGITEHFLALAESETEALQMVQNHFDNRPRQSDHVEQKRQYIIKSALEYQETPGTRLFAM